MAIWGAEHRSELPQPRRLPARVGLRQSSAALKRLKQAHPDQAATSDPSEVLKSPNIDAVAGRDARVHTFRAGQGRLWRTANTSFVEKPFTSTARQADELIELAERKNLKIIGGPHLPLHRRREKDAPAHRGGCSG